MTSQDQQYHPKDAISMTLKAASITGGAGLVTSAIQNSLAKQNIGAWGVFTRTGGGIAIFAAAGGAYEFARTASANLRETDDSYNPAIGGFFGGAILGLQFRTMPAVLGYGAAAAVMLAAYDYTGGSLSGWRKDQNEDAFDRKEDLRKNRRRSIDETIDDLGEGRGIQAPGYDVRRRARIRERYGIEIPEKFPPPRPVDS